MAADARSRQPAPACKRPTVSQRCSGSRAAKPLVSDARDCTCVRSFVRACMRACARACVHVCDRACVRLLSNDSAESARRRWDVEGSGAFYMVRRASPSRMCACPINMILYKNAGSDRQTAEAGSHAKCRLRSISEMQKQPLNRRHYRQRKLRGLGEP